ncbi:nucleotidyltransferase family protein [Altererythrobacter aquiaggeris]|uniref:nucleotidyltransferase family protein n=1 Tax=Aestuarierythrobacter aquiaggeris TaxID=1898396 RepID=UPI003015FEA3
MKPSALVLAGSRGERDSVALKENVSHKSLALVEGETLLARVIGALRDAGLTTISVSADDPDVMAEALRLGAEISPPESGPSGSVARGFAASGAPLLVTTADHALLRGEWVTSFIADLPAGADIGVALAPRAAVEAAVPGSKRTYLKFADGEWSGCNLFLLATPQAAQAIEAWRSVEANRKRPWRIAARLGVSTLWAYFRGRLTLDQAIVRLGKRLGVEARLVPAKDGLAAVDVDKPQDLAEVRMIAATAKTRQR